MNVNNMCICLCIYVPMDISTQHQRVPNVYYVSKVCANGRPLGHRCCIRLGRHGKLNGSSAVLDCCQTVSFFPRSIRRGHGPSDGVSVLIVANQVSPSGVVRSTYLTVTRHHDVSTIGRTICSNNEFCPGRSRR